MFAKVNGKDFKKALARVVSGTKPILSLLFSNGYVYIQSRKFVIADTPLKVLETDIVNGNDVTISIVYNEAVNLINDEGEVVLTVDEHLLTIRQEAFTWVAEEVPEDRVNVNLSDNHLEVKMDGGQLAQVASMAKTLGRAMKELGETTGVFNFRDNTCYFVQSNIALRRNVVSPDCSINSESLNEFITFLERDRITLTMLDNDKKFVKFLQANSTAITMSVGDVDMQNVETFERIVSSSKRVAIVKFTEFKRKLQTIIGAFGKVPVDMMFGEDSVGLYIEDGKVRCILGKTDGILETVRITMGQLYAIFSLFGNSNSVTISRNGNCFVFSDNLATLIVSGVCL